MPKVQSIMGAVFRPPFYVQTAQNMLINKGLEFEAWSDTPNKPKAWTFSIKTQILKAHQVEINFMYYRQDCEAEIWSLNNKHQILGVCTSGLKFHVWGFGFNLKHQTSNIKLY